MALSPLVRHLWRFLKACFTWRPLAQGGGLLLVLLLAASGYKLTGQPVTLVINGQPYTVRTHRLNVASVLREAGLSAQAEDIIWPPPGDGVAPGDVVSVQLARPVTIEADGRTLRLFSHGQRVLDVFDQAGVHLGPYDEVLVEGRVWSIEAGLPSPRAKLASVVAPDFPAREFQRSPDLERHRPAPIRFVVRRAIPVQLQLKDGPASTFYTTRHTVGEALLDQGFVLFLGDKVTPSLGTALSPGLRIFIERSRPVAIVADGRTLKTRTRREYVGEVLAQEGVSLMGQDYALPSPDTPLKEDMAIRVVRVEEALEIEEETIPFESQWLPDPDLELDTTVLRQTGSMGVNKSRTRVRYEDGREIWRVLEEEWVDSEPETRVIAYGTKITPRLVGTEAGQLPYWRKIRMLATSYSAATSGKSPDHPAYGITRSGLPAGYGVVAVDPSVIPLGTRLYVPGYGVALAGDTGGSILGKHIDLGFDEEEPPLWYRWTEVYILGDPPPVNEIRYVLPQWPQER